MADKTDITFRSCESFTRVMLKPRKPNRGFIRRILHVVSSHISITQVYIRKLKHNDLTKRLARPIEV